MLARPVELAAMEFVSSRNEGDVGTHPDGMAAASLRAQCFINYALA
jgi:hypothetical protein